MGIAGSRRLSELAVGLDVQRSSPTDPEIRGLAYDSRRVEPGYLFVAISGFVHDGNDFVTQAIEQGAIAVVSERSSSRDDVEWLRVGDARAALATLACAWFDNPSHQLAVAGVTGTNGKTTVTALLESLLATRSPAGRWSTTRVNVGDGSFSTPRTTPEALELQEALARMRASGCATAVVEVSSHALRLARVAGTRFAAATFTNLSPDHLDFHRDMVDYLDAKARLFEALPPDAPAIINLADDAGAELCRRASGTVRTYGWADTGGAVDYRIERFDSSPGHSSLSLAIPDRSLQLRTPLFGRANAENITAAVATAIEMGIDPEVACDVVPAFGGEPGRLQAIDCGQPFALFVDFAHTPGALRAALESCRSAIPRGRLIVVFGCGGDRDRAKRPLMGSVAAELADRVVVTSDNPRSESPERIIDEILAGIDGDALGRIEVQPDRTRAIDVALAHAGAGDCVLIAGKGHETEQVFADRTVAFDDRLVAAAAVERQRGNETARHR